MLGQAGYPDAELLVAMRGQPRGMTLVDAMLHRSCFRVPVFGHKPVR